MRDDAAFLDSSFSASDAFQNPQSSFPSFPSVHGIRAIREIRGSSFQYFSVSAFQLLISALAVQDMERAFLDIEGRFLDCFAHRHSLGLLPINRGAKGSTRPTARNCSPAALCLPVSRSSTSAILTQSMGQVSIRHDPSCQLPRRTMMVLEASGTVRIETLADSNLVPRRPAARVPVLA